MDTKPQVLGAGKPHSQRRRSLLAASALFAAGAQAAGSVIVPAQSYPGARLLQRMNAAGMPEMRPDTFGPMTQFVFPIAVAATGMDLYVADAGLGGLFRYDMALDAMAPMPGVRITQQSRIAALQDGSVVVANGSAVPTRRYARGGRPIQGIDPQMGAAFFDEVVADPNSGRFYGLDRVQGRLEELLPHGRGNTVLPPGILPDLPVAMAMDTKRLYVAGRACGCVVAVDMFGSRGKEVVVDDVANVTGMAVADGWLVLADGLERRLRIYRDGIQRADPSFADLRLINPMGMAVANGQLFVADPGGRRIASFRLRQ